MTDRKDSELFKLKFFFDDRAISPWKESYLVKEETVENLRDSWGPSAYLKFDVVNKNGEFEKVVFINSIFVVTFDAKPFHE